jgi:hypothetical protein
MTLCATRAVAGELFEPSAALTLDLAYDSNVLNYKGPDYVTRITPHVAFRIRGPNERLTIGYDVGFWEYARHEAKNTINHHLAAVFEAELTHRLTMRIADELTKAEDPGFLFRAGVVAPQTGILDNFVDANGTYQIDRRLAGWLGYTYRITTFEQPPPGNPPLHDGQEHDGAGGFLYRATRLDELLFNFRTQYFLVDGDSFAVTESPSLGWHHQFMRALDLRVEAGPLIYTDLALSTGTDVTWRGAGVLRFQHGPWRILASGARDLVSGTGAGSVLWAAYAALGGSYQIDENASVSLGASYFWNGDAPAHRVRFDGVAVDTAINWRVNNWFRVGAYYQFRWQEAREPDGPLPGITRNIVGIRLQGVVGAEAAPMRREVHP